MRKIIQRRGNMNAAYLAIIGVIVIASVDPGAAIQIGLVVIVAFYATRRTFGHHAP